MGRPEPVEDAGAGEVDIAIGSARHLGVPVLTDVLKWHASRRVPTSDIKAQLTGELRVGRSAPFSLKEVGSALPPYIKRHQSLKTSASCLDLRHSGAHTTS
jgi:hypothetical protein